MLVPALYALGKVDLPWSEKYGNTTLNIGQVEGGVAASKFHGFPSHILLFGHAWIIVTAKIS